MVKAYITSPPGDAFGISHILGAMRDFTEHILFVIKVERTEYRSSVHTHYSFIAVFRERGSVGGITALINQEGTTVGYNGTGPDGYAQMMQFVEENNITIHEADWADWERNYPAFTEKALKLSEPDEMGELSRIWSDFLTYHIWDYMPRHEVIVSDEWLAQAAKNG